LGTATKMPPKNFKTKVLITADRSLYQLSEQHYEQSTSIGWYKERRIHSDR